MSAYIPPGAEHTLHFSYAMGAEALGNLILTSTVHDESPAHKHMNKIHTRTHTAVFPYFQNVLN